MKTTPKEKAKTGEKAKAKRTAVKTAKKTAKKTAAAPKAAKASKPKTAGRKTGIGREIDKALSFCKSLTLEDVAKLGEDGRRKLSEMFGEIVRIGESLLKGMKKTNNTKK